MPGLGSGRHFINMETQPSSKGKAIFDSRQNMITDQDSVYSKDGMQSPGQSLSTNENPVSVQKMSSVNDISETGNSLVAVDCLPSTSGKAADERESNFRQQKYSYVKDTEDTISKSLCITPVNGAGTIDIGTSSVCMSASIEIGKQYVVCKDGELHDTYMFHGPCMNSQAVQECPIGKGLFSSTLEKPEKQAKQEVTREQGKHMFHKVVTGSGPENIKIESFNHTNSNESLLKRELQKGAIFVDNGVHLTEILEELVRSQWWRPVGHWKGFGEVTTLVYRLMCNGPKPAVLVHESSVGVGTGSSSFAPFIMLISPLGRNCCVFSWLRL